MLVKSTDLGATWTSPQNLSSFYGGGPPPSPQCASTFASGHGIQVEGGAMSGRLVVPGYHIHACTQVGSEVVEYSHVWFSDDHGATWCGPSSPRPAMAPEAACLG